MLCRTLPLLLIALPLVAAEKPTFHKDVLPILQNRCQSCHRPGEAAPFSLLTYKDARPWAKALKQAVVTSKMPPWNADPSVGKWKNDRRLSPEEVKVFSDWADSGAAEGNPKDAKTLAVTFMEGWQIGKPDAVLEMAQAYDVPANGVVDYQWIMVPGFKEDKWIQAFEVRPGNRAVVHHVAAFLRRPGSNWLAGLQPGVPSAKAPGGSEAGSSDGIIAEYVPGIPPLVLPEGYGFKLPAGTDIMLQVHYTPNGKETQDTSKVGIVFTKEKPRYRVMTTATASLGLRIPPNEANYKANARLLFGTDVEVLGINPHMHLRGKSAEIRVVYPDGRTEDILRVPKYDFNWQLTYEPATPWKWPAGTRLEAVSTYDNSANNPSNPDPSKEVRWGDQTFDEMMAVYMHVAIPVDQDPRTLFQRPATQPYTQSPKPSGE
jgi:hypothetical protein